MRLPKVGLFALCGSLALSCVTHRKPAPVSEPAATLAPETAGETSAATSAPRPHALEPGPRPQVPLPMDLTASGTSAQNLAFMLLVGEGVAQIFSTPEVRSELSGNCQYGEPDNAAVTSPCIRAKIELLDDKHLVLATSFTNQSGDFRFWIPESGSYFVRVQDRRGRASTLEKKVGRSQFVTLFLKP